MSPAIAAAFSLIHLLRERTMSSHAVNGCEIFDEATGPCAFQVTSQFERPPEFLQTLLDMVRVVFEPEPPGTMFLNSNIDFVLNEIGHTPFRLGYLSAISCPGETFADCDRRAIAPRLDALGYRKVNPNATFWMLTYGTHTAPQRQVIRKAIMNQYRAGFTIDQVVPKMSAVAQGLVCDASRSGKTYAGFSRDEALGANRFRLSVWLFLPVTETK